MRHSLRTKATALLQRRKYRTGQLRNTGHNCSREMSVIFLLGFEMQPKEKHFKDFVPNCAREHSLSSPWREQWSLGRDYSPMGRASCLSVMLCSHPNKDKDPVTYRLQPIVESCFRDGGRPCSPFPCRSLRCEFHFFILNLHPRICCSSGAVSTGEEGTCRAASGENTSCSH